MKIHPLETMTSTLISYTNTLAAQSNNDKIPGKILKMSLQQMVDKMTVLVREIVSDHHHLRV